ncbi:UDP-glucose:glycoprotein glucosyltransferase isoform X2 [Tribolium castaneum]|uniref:UDP-glucose:glycoprotein glucosyltransferase isoform X2 n=1 Tax=Tribolium castaneum TaxID=7070 RepID=UPI00077D96E5|nr:PREDICTED: UDP-glucose:glycoprotein glucosyltransferase isoform X1 [Tribolium castaneum]XP_015835987.1 PREDICTED: UDP-glucose:glycoprotein glucosyltransferase isoform X1 [Tribolium castaneum]|eukprot:XP_015835986.1 PREDICTED: UDP-glucose:glycoprotein glucosyltransferase isoform X1 [Tribolium castaneum]
MRWRGVVFVVLQLFIFGGCKVKKSKSVTTLLEAKWETTPLVLEVVEYLRDESSDFFWSFVNSISSLNPPLATLENDRVKYNIMMDHASKLVTTSELSVLKLGLSLHIYSPKVQMFRQIATERELPSCAAAVDIGGIITCDSSKVQSLIANYNEQKKVDIFNVDTHYPGSENRSKVAILYAELGTKEFADFHNVLKQEAEEGNIDYVVRHYVQTPADKKLRLSGFGVELQMKSTEYKVQDDAELHDDPSSEESSQEEEEIEIEGFNFKKLKTLFPDHKKDLDKLRQHLEESSNEMAPLKVWQFQELSLQAAERIMSAPKDEALKVFTNIAQNFPMQAKGLVKTVVNPELKKEMKLNSDIFASTLNLQPSDTALFINGMFYDVDLVDIYGILDVLRQELRTMEGLQKIGVGNKRLSSLLALDFSDGSSGQEFAIDIRDSAVNWINDIETEAKYSRWSSSVMDLLRPTFPGMIRQVRKNLFNLILIIDPTEPKSRDLVKLLESFVVHTAPLRVGIVFAVDASTKLTGLQDAGVAMQCAFNYVVQKKSPLAALSFVKTVLGSASEEVKVDDVKKELKAQFGDDYLDILGEDSDYDFGRQLSIDFIQRTGQRVLPQALLNGIPLPSSSLNIDDFEEAVLQEVMSQTSLLQKAVYRGKLSDTDDVVEYLMTQPNVMPRLNERILNKDQSLYLDMTGTATTSMNVEDLAKLSPRDMTATAIDNFKYFFSPKKGKQEHTMTYWVVGDLKYLEARQLLLAALEHAKSENHVRVTFIPNVDSSMKNMISKLVLTALSELSPEKALDYVLTLLRDDKAAEELEHGGHIKFPPELSGQVNNHELNLKMLRVYSRRVLNLNAGERALVANGRLLGPFEVDESFTVQDFGLLERFSSATYLEKIQKAIEKSADEEEELSSNSLLKVISLLVSRPQSRTRFEIQFTGDEHSVLKIPASQSDKVAFDIVAVVDPVSRGAQKLGPILQVLQEVLNVNIRVFLNSVEKNSDMPVKSFYRFVLEPEIQFTEDGKQTAGPIARFNNMPTSPLLTQNYHVPENWLVEVVRSVYDLDNIRLEDVDSNVHSEYELEYLLLEGHCFEATTGSPPRGLQITLGTERQPVIVDTIVMANLGYFQLKANPGAWILRLRQGRSAEIYDIVSHDGSDTPANSSDIKVLISTLRSHIVKLRVQKKPDKFNMDLLSEDEPNSGIWNSITSLYSHAIRTVTSSFSKNEEEPDDKLNIFSVASGHLYERFLRIMMLSVLKHTKTPVKFWFLKNYLSPQIKDFLPYMAKEYGFEYELVQYKWPRWLHQQTEKQRIIWGYKILFLDVLFPLDVKKIIFVDADQVVRADLKELQELDLGGAPYGYTPFCDSRKEMDGFRFWKLGYWRNHLQGRKYHISALYVVDLKRFRRIAAGDRLRGQYQALSQDPNSLSNLDQDLPNNMIHQVGIKSLPQEWLWCETWCDDESKARAKTIDLCNNPMTKEAKLTAAMRILPEWKGYDEEIRQLQKKIDSGVLDPDPENHIPDTTDKHIEL